MTRRLCLSGLKKIADVASVPTYDRRDLSPGIVHIGVGNFHRAHQGVYLHKLFDRKTDLDWAVIGAGLKPYDIAMREKLLRQDCLTTVVELDPSAFSATVTGSMIDYAEIEPSVLVRLMSRPEIRIVSLTVTEGGYFIDAHTGGFDRNHADITHDARYPDSPKTVFGVLIAALMARRSAGLPPFTVLSCANLPENGRITRQAVLGLAETMPGDVGRWIADNVAFPSGMVDCITPATGDREKQIVRSEFAIEDLAPVVCEPFRQWVLEDEFPAGRPSLEDVGVTFVGDVAPYERMKLWILNGGHAAIAYASALLGITFVHEAMADPSVRGFLDRLQREEIIPSLPSISGVDYLNYYKSVAERFSNSEVGDTIPRLCLDGSNRQPKFIFPAIESRLSDDLSIDGLALEVALWCRYCAGVDEKGGSIAIEDENAAILRSHAQRAQYEPRAFLEMLNIFGPLARNEIFADAFEKSVKALWSQGVRHTLNAFSGHRVDHLLSSG